MSASIETQKLEISGMNCASCVGRVERALQAVHGVDSVSVNLATESALVKTHEPIRRDAFAEALEKAGYPLKPALEPEAGVSNDGARAAEREHEAEQLKRSVLLAALLTLPVFTLEMGAHFIPGVENLVHESLGHQNNWILQFVLTTLILILPGRRFFEHGIPALLRLAPDMNSLVVLGTSAAWGFSALATFAPGLLPAGTVNVYYEAAAVIVTLILLGRYLEARARGRTSEAITRLLQLQAHTARVERDGQDVEVPVSDIQVGDRVAVQPGEKVPLDGEVVSGSSYIDESMITGEPMPVAKKAGAMVTGGTLNKNGAFRFRVTRIGDDTVLAQIVRMVEAAQGSKLPIQSLVDRITLWFVPAVMGIALLTLLVWLVVGPEPALTLALVNAVAVLIVACPCAMGLATPVSIMVATGRAAEMGVLFRDGAALQALRETRVIALDKTGTITHGKPDLTDLLVQDGYEKGTVLGQLAAVEAESEHPIAEAIVASARNSGIELPVVSDFEAIPGHGLRAQVENAKILVGNARLMQINGVNTTKAASAVERLASAGKTPFFLAVDGKLAAIVAVADTVKPTTPAAIAGLHALGFRVAMISGDNRHTAEAVARSLGIDEVFAEVLPQGKVETLQQLRSRGQVLTYVGDGINDAPALAAADIGIAMGNGTDVAIESASVVLMNGDLGSVVNAVRLARDTMRNIKQNLFWAFAYNVALIPVAAGALYPFFGIMLSPILAAAAMALSSVFVLSNALRLRRFSPSEEASGRSEAVHAPAH